MAAQSATALPVHRLDLATYDRMVASGALEGQRVELLEGLLVEMSPQSPAHATVIGRLERHFGAARRWWVRAQCPLQVPPGSEPEPDLAVFAREPSPLRHPRTALLVIEVAVGSRAIDRGVKASLYARAPIPVYWLVDVPGRAVEVRTRPGPHGYRHCEIYREGARVPSPLEGVDDFDVAAALTGLRD